MQTALYHAHGSMQVSTTSNLSKKTPSVTQVWHMSRDISQPVMDSKRMILLSLAIDIKQDRWSNEKQLDAEGEQTWTKSN